MTAFTRRIQDMIHGKGIHVMSEKDKCKLEASIYDQGTSIDDVVDKTVYSMKNAKTQSRRHND